MESIATKEIAYGPEHTSQVSEFIGQPFTQWGDNPTRIFDTCVYVRPYWKAYGLNGGRVLVSIEKGFSNLYRIFENSDQFYQWKNGHFDSMPDPETGRFKAVAQ